MQAEHTHLLKLGRAEEKDGAIAEWKVEELRRRKKYSLQNPESGYSWEQVKSRARAQNG